VKARWDVMASIDVTTVEAWTKGGLTTLYLLFVMELKTHRVNLAGCTTDPNETWMKTIALELTNCEDGFLKSKRYLMMDRDATFCKSFRDLLHDEGVKLVRFPPRSANLIAHLERFFGSLKSECLHKLILFGEKATRGTVRAFLVHYHTERNHQGLGRERIVPMVRPRDMDAETETSERLGGLLRSYLRAASIVRSSHAPRHSGL
jgi:transposase InsO family protein